MLDALFSRYDGIIVLDTETTGINHKTDEIIELAALRAVPDAGGYRIETEMDEFIRLSPGKWLSPVITNLTGITPEMLKEDGIPKQEAAQQFAAMLNTGSNLIVAYNAQFDLCFLYYFLSRLGLAQALQGSAMLDAMTVYKDRQPYPHKLCNAVEAYHLQGRNTHRAIDDAMVTLELLEAMERELPDLERYINLFGYNAKYGVSGPRIRSVTYAPQSYEPTQKLYETVISV